MSRNNRVEQIARSNSAAQSLVSRFVAGTEVSDAVRVCQELSDSGRLATVDYLGEDTTDIANSRSRSHRAKSSNLTDRIFAIFFFHISNHTITTVLAKIDIEVGHRYPFRI